MRLKEKNLLQKFASTLKKFSAQGAKKVEYGIPQILYIRSYPNPIMQKSSGKAISSKEIPHLIIGNNDKRGL